MRPRYQIHVPCKLNRVIDGDTIEVTAFSGFLWRIRLDGINCKERRSEEGIKAKHFCEGVLEEAAAELSMEFELPENSRDVVMGEKRVNVLDIPTFNRLAGDIWVGESRKLSDIMVNAGHAERV